MILHLFGLSNPHSFQNESANQGDELKRQTLSISLSVVLPRNSQQEREQRAVKQRNMKGMVGKVRREFVKNKKMEKNGEKMTCMTRVNNSGG